MSGLVVIDASVAVKWLVDEVHSDKAHALARFWVRNGTRPVAPHLMPVEVSSALYRRVVQQEISPDDAIELLNTLFTASIELLEPTGIHQRAIELAVQCRQNAVYDAHYLALAETLGCDLWTADERFCRAAAPTFEVRSLASFGN